MTSQLQDPASLISAEKFPSSHWIETYVDPGSCLGMRRINIYNSRGSNPGNAG